MNYLARKRPEYKFYEQTEKKSQIITKVLVGLAVSTGVTSVTGLMFALSIVSMLQGNFDTSTWFFPCKIAVPFDTTSILGWYMKLILFGLYAVFTGYLVVSTLTAYFVSCCYYIDACCDHLNLMFSEMDKIVNLNESLSHLQIADVQKRFKIAVGFHIKIME